MYTIFISMGLSAIVALFLCYFKGSEENGWPIFRYLRAASHGTALGLFIGIGVASTIGYFNSSIVESWRTTEQLGPLHHEKDYRDIFLLSPSQANPEGVYVYMVKSERWHSFSELPANNPVQVVVDKNLHKSGCLVKVRGRRVVNDKPWLNNWAMIVSPEHVVRYEIHVPVGTVLENFQERPD
jgi:hypothetical protein